MFKIKRYCKLEHLNCDQLDAEGYCLESGELLSKMSKCPLLVGKIEKREGKG